MGVDTGLEICGKIGTLPTLRPDLDKKTYCLDGDIKNDRHCGTQAVE
jgi:hypothetical protein